MFRSSSPRRRLAAAVTGPALAAGVAAIEHWTQDDDGVAGFPYIGFNWPICYNTDQLEKAGVTEIPSSVDDLLAVAEELRAIGSQPMALGGAEWPVTNFVAWMVEQYVEPDEARELFAKGGSCASPGAVKGLDLFGQLREKVVAAWAG